MSAPATINHSQKGTRSHDAHPAGLHIRAKLLPARRRVSPLAILLPANRGTRHPIRGLRRANGNRPHTVAHQHPIDLIAAALIHLRRLSSASPDGSTPIGKAFADGQNLFARGSKND